MKNVFFKKIIRMEYPNAFCPIQLNVLELGSSSDFTVLKV